MVDENTLADDGNEPEDDAPAQDSATPAPAPATQSNYQLAQSRLGTFLEGNALRGKFNEDAGNEDLEAIAKKSEALLSNAEGLGLRNGQNYANAIHGALEQKNQSALGGAFNQLHKFQYGRSMEEFNKLFTENKAIATINSAPAEFQEGLAFTLYNPAYSGSHTEAHKNLTEVILRQEIMGLALKGKKPRHNEDLDEKKIKEIVNGEYEKNRTPYDDNEDLDGLARNLDLIFGMPLREYLENAEVLTKKFLEEELPQSSVYLADMVSEENLRGYFIAYEQKKAEAPREPEA